MARFAQWLIDMRAIDLTDQRFTRLVVKRFVSKTRFGNRQFLCQCDCGNTLVVASGDLRSGHTQSCGCLQRERASAASLIHGEASKSKGTTLEYQAWLDMIKRCENPNHIAFRNYGGRGIKVCKRWRTSYKNFLADMGRKPSPDHTLDRYPDKNGNYEPSNCRWATYSQQAKNRRPVKRRTYRKRSTTLNAKQLRQLLRYYPKTGIFIWLVNHATGKRRKGMRAGTLKGHRLIKINGIVYIAARLAFLWMTGRFPVYDIQRKNADPTDDSWANIRDTGKA